MNVKQAAAMLIMSGTFAMPVASVAQYTQREHDQARYDQDRHDARHHTKAKVVGGSAVGGAVVGGLLGGGKGAVIGAGAGAGGGLLANKARKDKGVRQRERRDRGDYR